MSAITILRTEQQDDIRYLREQLSTGGVLQNELWECAVYYLIRMGIYDVTMVEEEEIRAYKKYLSETGNYTKKQVQERSVALRNIQKFWVDKEYADLNDEIRGYQGADPQLTTNVKRFLIRHRIHHLREIDYTVRQMYEEELLKGRSSKSCFRYLKVMDRLKQSDIRKEMNSLSGMARNQIQYREQIIFLPYLPNQELAKDFEYVQDKNELVWDFKRTAPDTLRRQVFQLLQYILENVYPDNPKERRVRFLLPLRWLYDYCTEEHIEDLELLEQCQIDGFERIVEQKVVNVGNSMQIVDNSRKMLFLTAPEIHWHANVWYMERFHLQEDRINPSNPVQRLSFLEVTNKRNRELIQEYAKYHVGIGRLTVANIRAQLYHIRDIMEHFKEETSICQVNGEQLDHYFRELQNREVKDETINKKILDIASFYQYLKIKGYIKKIPFVPEYYIAKSYQNHIDRNVEEKTYMEILHKLHLFPEIDRLIFLHLWCTGLRISEVCTLKGDAYYWDRVDAWLKVYQIKMKADKMIPIPFQLYKIMKSYIEKNHISSKEYVFKGRDGGAYRVGSFNKSFQECCMKNGIAGSTYNFQAHDYRHTLATRFYDDGVSLQTIRDYLGHASENMTKQYVDYMPRKIARANDDYFKKPGNSLASTIKAKKRGDKK